MNPPVDTPWTALIDAPSLAAALASDTPPVVLDARFELTNPQAGREAFAQGHLPGAHYADLDLDLAGPVAAHTGRHPLPDPNAFAARLGAWGVASGPPATQVVLYDAGSGAFAARGWWLLRWLGHQAVAVLDGGLAHWQAQGLPISTAAATARPAVFQPAPKASMCIDAPALQLALARSDVLLADARAAARFAGEQEPIDPVAGHIPGAVNLPFQENLTADGRFREPEALRETIAGLLGQRDSTQLVAMCGSGVTACHLLLALAAAGLPDGRLYPGSWSEWIRDPARPVATSHS